MSEIHKVLKASGLRKVFMGLFIFCILSVLLWNKSLGGDDFTSLSKILVMSLFAGNAAEHFAPKDQTPGA